VVLARRRRVCGSTRRACTRRACGQVVPCHAWLHAQQTSCASLVRQACNAKGNMEFREHHREVVSLVCDLLSDTILKLPVGTLGCAAHCTHTHRTRGPRIRGAVCAISQPLGLSCASLLELVFVFFSMWACAVRAILGCL